MITHTNESSTSEDEEMSTSDGGNSETETNVLQPMPAMELTQIEFEAYPPADEDWDGVRALLDGLVKGLTLDVGNFSQTLIDNYKVGTVIKGADIEEGEDDPVFAVASILPLSLFSDSAKLKQLTTSLLSKCDADTTGDIDKILSSPDTAFLLNAKFNNLPLQITAQLYKALKMELITERRENASYNVRNLVMLAKSFQEPEQGRKVKRSKHATPSVQYEGADLSILSEIATHSFSWKVTDETLAPMDTTKRAEEVSQGYRTVLVVSTDRFLKSVDKIVEILSSDS